MQPCPVKGHQRGWSNQGPNYRPLPGNWESLKKLVTARDGYRCKMCGTTRNLQLDHIIERSDGGTDDIRNLRWLCPKCHKTKTDEAKRKRRERRKKRDV